MANRKVWKTKRNSTASTPKVAVHEHGAADTGSASAYARAKRRIHDEYVSDYVDANGHPVYDYKVIKDGEIRLDLSDSQLSALPPDIGMLTGLTALNLRGCRLTALPPEIRKLKKLRTLLLGGNRLSTLPVEIGQLTALQELDLAHNQLSVLPSEIGQLTGLMTLDLSGNQLTALPLEIGHLQHLAKAAGEAQQSGYIKKRAGLFIENNPLPLPYPTLIGGHQPAATRNVLAWLRGELDPASLAGLGDAPDAAAIAATPPSLPSQGVGPHFEIGESGAIALTPPEALDRHGNNVRRLRSLHPALRKLSGELTEGLSLGNAPHANLRDRAEGYRLIIDQDLDRIDFSLLFIEGVRLANAENAAADEMNRGDLPPLVEPVRERLDTLLRLHGTFMLSTVEGMESIAAEERYRRRPEEESAYREAAIEVATSLQNKPDIIEASAAAVVLGAAEQIGKGANPVRSGVAGAGVLRNVTIALTGAATLAVLVLGPGALIAGIAGFAGTLTGLLASESLKKSRPFGTVTAAVAGAIDGAAEAEWSRILPMAKHKFDRQLAFVTTVEPKLRALATKNEQCGWISEILDWLKDYPADREKTGRPSKPE